MEGFVYYRCSNMIIDIVVFTNLIWLLINFLFLTVKCWLQKRGMELVMQGEEEKKLHWVYAIIF